MNDLDRARRAHSLMQDALALPEAERGRFLREQCGDDDKLVAQVQGLLANSKRARSFFDRLGDGIGKVLERSAGHDTATSAAASEHDAPLVVGQAVGHFRIVGELGRGGMGTVYRATDVRLGRDVAVKILPAATRDSELGARFEQEARLLAALSHVNIAAIFGVQDHDDQRVLILELIDGPGLDQRLERSRLSIRESLDIAAQIARALDAAHRAGIVHRDLKPSNVKTDGATGIVKVLDFGIATVLPHAQLSLDATDDAIVTTGPGRVLGTIAYMSPEQARGDPVDERTDIWAWGCVLYEMLSGKRPFHGRTVTDTLAAIIERDPDWSLLPATTPPEVTRILRRCLRKDPRRRLRDAGDVWLVLDEVLHPPAGGLVEPAATTEVRPWRGLLPWALAAAAVVAGILVGRWFFGGEPEPTRRLELLVRGDQLRTAVGGRAIAISDDGSTLAYTIDGALNLRPLDAFQSSEVEAAVGAESPAFSPDGEWLTYFARGQLRKTSLLGGEPFALCAAALPRGADWGADDRIVFSDGTGLFSVRGSGGACETMRAPDDDQHRYVWPSWLPGERVLFQLNGPTGSTIAMLDPATGQITDLAIAGSDPRYLPSNHLLFTRLGTLFAVRFDPDTARASGTPRPVLDSVSAESTGASHLAVSDGGVLAYVPDPDPERQLVWVDMTGSETTAISVTGDYSTPRVSPDGRRVAVVMRRAGERNVWIHDLGNRTTRQLTEGLSSIWPAWSPDGSRVTFSMGTAGPATLWSVSPDGGTSEPMTSEGRHQYASAWAARVNVVAWFQIGANGTRDIWVRALDQGLEAAPAVTSSAHEQGPALSPDARWLAYASNATGRNEVYIETCRPCGTHSSEPPTGRWRVSLQGGGEPRWSPDANRIYYRAGTTVMAAAIDLTGRTPRVEAPVELFDGPYVIGQSGNANWDIAPDGERFLMVKGPDGSGEQRIRVILSWFSELASATR